MKEVAHFHNLSSCYLTKCSCVEAPESPPHPPVRRAFIDGVGALEVNHMDPNGWILCCPAIYRPNIKS
jgi:hypothetical protein